MANINVEDLNIENGGNQILGDPFEVTVHVNNREIVTPDDWKETHCEYEGNNGTTYSGHGADVEVEIVGSGGVVDSESTSVCAPTMATPQPDPRPTFTFDLNETGTYDVRATVRPKGHGPTSTETYTVNVEDTGQQDPPPNDDDGGDGDDGGGLAPFGDADNDGHRNFVDPAPHDPEIPEGGGGPFNIGGQLDKMVLLLGLLAFAWALSSASDTVEAVT